jgi:hypothetical protein
MKIKRVIAMSAAWAFVAAAFLAYNFTFWPLASADVCAGVTPARLKGIAPGTEMNAVRSAWGEPCSTVTSDSDVAWVYSRTPQSAFAYPVVQLWFTKGRLTSIHAEMEVWWAIDEILLYSRTEKSTFERLGFAVMQWGA